VAHALFPTCARVPTDGQEQIAKFLSVSESLQMLDLFALLEMALVPLQILVLAILDTLDLNVKFQSAMALLLMPQQFVLLEMVLACPKIIVRVILVTWATCVKSQFVIPCLQQTTKFAVSEMDPVLAKIIVPAIPITLEINAKLLFVMELLPQTLQLALQMVHASELIPVLASQDSMDYSAKHTTAILSCLTLLQHVLDMVNVKDQTVVFAMLDGQALTVMCLFVLAF